MKFIKGHNRNQINLFPVSLDELIDPDNEVRIIDLFVESLSIKDYGFRTDFPENGRTAYHPSDLLRLFIYGYLNKFCSSRDLEKECKRNIEVIEIENQLKESGDKQVSTSDPESRQIMLRNNITEVAYNVQSMVDSKNNIPIDYKVTNQNDSKAMGNMVQRARCILGTNEFTVLYDKGFHTGSELKTAQELGVETIVAILSVPSASQAPNHDYNYEHFLYDECSDTYTCPQGQILHTNSSWYKERTSSGNIIFFKQYKTKDCRSCKFRPQCTRSKTCRLIHRSEYAEYYERNRINTLEKEHLYKRRQAIVEHPYGTIKRQWGFSYILTKEGINRASADVGFIFIAYNIRRIINILGQNLLKEYLRILISLFLTVADLSRRKIRHLEAVVFRSVIGRCQI
jgi:hypothetical protein